MAAVKLITWSTGLLFAPTMVLYFFAGIAVAPVQAQALAAQPAHSGAASGLLTALQMVAGAAVVQLVGFSHNGTPYPMFAGLIACSAGTLAALAWLTMGPRAAKSGQAYVLRAQSFAPPFVTDTHFTRTLPPGGCSQAYAPARHDDTRKPRQQRYPRAA
jgi:hypothetical protein